MLKCSCAHQHVPVSARRRRMAAHAKKAGHARLWGLCSECGRATMTLRQGAVQALA